MHALRLKETKSVPVKYIRARCGVRYWEDATVNGEKDTDGSRIPLREGTAADNDDLGGGNWLLTIDLDTGKIEGWPEGTTASVHYKVCDDGDYELLDADRNVVASIDGYVPSLMCPEGEGYGDYVIMKIAADGTIAKWKADLSEFEKSGDDRGGMDVPLTQTEKLNTLSTALFPPPEATDKHHHTIDNSVDVNLGAALYDLRRTGADASCIATIERVLGQLTVARRIVEAA